jgi:hypothetical protein
MSWGGSFKTTIIKFLSIILLKIIVGLKIIRKAVFWWSIQFLRLPKMVALNTIFEEIQFEAPTTHMIIICSVIFVGMTLIKALRLFWLI